MSTSFYYNVEKKAVETGPSQRGFSETRLGPYDTEAEAAKGLDTLHKRNAEADEADSKWRDG